VCNPAPVLQALHLTGSPDFHGPDEQSPWANGLLAQVCPLPTLLAMQDVTRCALVARDGH